MVTHRETNMKRANKVLVLDKGGIVASGSLKDVSKCDVYRRIFNLTI